MNFFIRESPSYPCSQAHFRSDGLQFENQWPSRLHPVSRLRNMHNEQGSDSTGKKTLDQLDSMSPPNALLKENTIWQQITGNVGFAFAMYGVSCFPPFAWDFRLRPLGEPIRAEGKGNTNNAYKYIQIAEQPLDIREYSWHDLAQVVDVLFKSARVAY